MTPSPPVVTRTRRASRRSLWRDAVEASAWLVAASTIALFLHRGGAQFLGAWDVVNAFGRLAGLAAASLVMLQLLLISRSPWIERAFGHDRATALHTRMGKVAFVAMIAHLMAITFARAGFDGRNYLDQVLATLRIGWFMVAAYVGIVLFTVIVVVSLARIRPRWKYQNWHAVHLFMYAAIAFVIPHQFLEGSTFRGGGVAWWYWFTLYVVAIGSLLVFRVIVPLVQYRKRGLVVAGVTTLADGTTSITMTGRDLGSLRASAGQFFLWRFLAAGMWREAHPYSLSAGPAGGSIRITAKPSGDGSGALAGLRPGTKVLAEGPLGVFTDDARVAPSLVLVAAGIGITPIRALLEDLPDGEECTVIVRARSRDEAPLVDEVESIAAAKGATVHVLLGSRGDGWRPEGSVATLGDLAPHLPSADVFVCGPAAWSAEVEAEARALGVRQDAIHREVFAW